MTDDDALGWRYFRLHEIREAKLWAAMGGIAVHDNEGAFPFRRYKRTAHLLARDAAALIAAAKDLGLKQSWIQRDSALHFDLFGSPLKRAIAKCEGVPAWWPDPEKPDLTARLRDAEPELPPSRERG